MCEKSASEDGGWSLTIVGPEVISVLVGLRVGSDAAADDIVGLKVGIFDDGDHVGNADVGTKVGISVGTMLPTGLLLGDADIAIDEVAVLAGASVGVVLARFDNS